MSLGGKLGTLVGRRLRQVGEGFAEGARQARSAYRAEIAAELRRRAAPAPVTEVDPRIAGFYANLEVEPGADLKAITRAWKKLVVDFHPDRYGADPARQAAATRLVQELNHAYRELVAHLGQGGGKKPQAPKNPRK